MADPEELALMRDPGTKLRWAQKHLDHLNAELTAFMGSDPQPYRLGEEIDPETGDQIGTFEIVKPIPDDPFALIAGDFAQNLRSALDHLAYAIATGSPSRPVRTQFPIFPRETDYTAKRGKNPSYRDTMLEGVAERHRAFIDRLQPYNAGDGAEEHPLAVLNWFTNADKHRVLHPAFVVLDSIRFTVTPPTGDVMLRGPLQRPRLDHGAELFRIVRLRPGPKVSVESETTFVVGFGERGITAQRLEDIANFVVGIFNWFDHDLRNDSATTSP